MVFWALMDQVKSHCLDYGGEDKGELRAADAMADLTLLVYNSHDTTNEP